MEVEFEEYYQDMVKRLEKLLSNKELLKEMWLKQKMGGK